jgi:hypothetical protein
LNESLLVSYGDNVNAGTVTASASYAGDANHHGSSDTKSFTIDKAGSTTLVTCPPSVIYNGAAHTPCTATVTGAGGLNESSTVTYTDNTFAGTATASASYAGDANHTGSSHSTTFVIDKATPQITWPNPAGITYPTALGDDQLNATANVPGGDRAERGQRAAPLGVVHPDRHGQLQHRGRDGLHRRGQG